MSELSEARVRERAYNPQRFERLVGEFQDQEAQLLNWKASEYAPDADRLQNFRQVAELMGQRPATVALTYLLKHLQAITVAVLARRFRWLWHYEGGEGLKQRIADARNYLLLLAACLDEEAEQPESGR